MTTTQNTKQIPFDRMVAQFRNAKHTYETARLGSVKADAAERTMNRLLKKADDLGLLLEFVRTVTA